MIWPFRRKPAITEAELPEVDASAIIRRARRLRFRVKSSAVSALSGAYVGARPGIGLTFAELRAYEPGDDVRHLDWNVTARQGRPYVRRFVEERSLTVWVIVDLSASMRFGPEGRSKADRAAQAAALLATAAVHSGDRVGLALVSDRLEAEVRPDGGDRHLSRVIRTLIATPSASRRTDLTVGLSRLKRNARRALVVLLSDFLDPDPGNLGVWRRAARRHELIAVRFVEPREENLPSAGLLRVEAAETGGALVVDSGAQQVRKAYARAAVSRAEAFRRWCSALGMAGYDVSTATDPVIPLTRIFSGKATRRRRP